MTELLNRYLGPLLLPVAILVAAFFLAPLGDQIPESFSGLWRTGPYVMFAILTVLGLAYNRGRALLVALMLVLLMILEEHPGRLGIWGQEHFVTLVVTVLLPINLALIGWYRERGVITGFGLMRLGIIVAQLVAVGVYYHVSPDLFTSVVADFGPKLSYIVFALCGCSLATSALVRRSAFTYALVIAYAGFLLGLLYEGQPNLFHANSIAIGLILSIAILRESYDMAYRDELTHLPQRRALNELFMSLGGDYAVAMIDVDHFKNFNDTHGHEIGDDVLKMVASQIDKVGDGGKAFRYGGEEFTVVYPGKVKEQALRSLEKVRDAIEHYEMVLRSPRPKDQTTGGESAKRGKGAQSAAKTVSVTISIGVADRADRTETSGQVLKKADEALYRAKKTGRNRLVVA
ncbi:MAG: GGDEF domain-containing protein [Pseudomonadales bacterium]